MKTPLAICLIAFSASLLLAAEERERETFVDYVVENASAIPAPLIEGVGDAAAGPAVFAAAGCADCHSAPGFEDAPNIGPDLADVGARLTTGEIRLMIVDPSIPAPSTNMPGYYSVGIFGEAPDELVGRTRLSAEEVEHLVAWLAAIE